MAAAASEAEISRVRDDLASLIGEADAVKQAGAGTDLAELSTLLTKAAGVYRSLYSAAQAHGVDVPYEATLNNVGGLVWMEQIMVSGPTTDMCVWQIASPPLVEYQCTFAVGHGCIFEQLSFAYAAFAAPNGAEL